jgi:hypothetical protein
MLSRNLLFIITATTSQSLLPAIAQTPASDSSDAIRVKVALNADGSRTVYQFDSAKHEATATTTEPDGKARGKIIYQVGEAGRFVSGVVFGPDEKFLFKSLYKYDAAGRVEQETHLARDDSVINKVIFKYNSSGKQIGYSVVDPTGKVISGTVSPTPTPAKPRNALGR